MTEIDTQGPAAPAAPPPAINKLEAIRADTQEIKAEAQGIRAEAQGIGEGTAKVAAQTRRVAGSNRVLAVAVLGLALLGAFGMFWVGHQLADLQDRVHPAPEEEQRRLQRQIRTDALVEDALAALVEETGADRAVGYLAHNGTRDLTGRVPFMFLSAVYLHLRPGVSWREPWSRPAPLAIYSPTLRRMFKNPDRPVCVRRTLGDPDQTQMARERMAERGTAMMVICPMHGANGVSGFVAAEFLRKDGQGRVSDESLTERVEGTARFVYGALTAPAKPGR